LNALSGFHQVARTLGVAVSGEFEQVANATCVTKTDAGHFYGYRVTDPKDSALSLLFDVNGVIAGVQAWFPQDEILNNTENKVRYYKVPMYQNVTVENKKYFVLTAYFVDPSIICEGGRSESALTTEGTGTGLWFQNGATPADLLFVPKNRTEAIAEGWTKNACFPGMGSHNFYEVEKYEETGCLETQAAFILYSKAGDMMGFGFHIQGVAQSERWTEYPPNLAISAILGAPVPQCVLTQNDLVGTTTMHVYFVNNPWLINCF